MRTWRVICVAIVGGSLAGCAALGELFCTPHCNASRRSSSSLVEFLYPNGQEPPRENSVPELHVPLRVGLAFLPAHGAGESGPDAALRDQLLERIRQHFQDREFVSEIVVIPDYYLTSQRGFGGLEAVQRLYSVDVIALVSYDQVTNEDENGWSLGYLTIVGAYVLKGNRYDVSTLVDLAVVDPATRSLILRAGGTDTRHGNTTLIDQSRESREGAAAGFSGASDQLIQHFDAALGALEAEVRAGHANVHVVRRNAAGSGGAGALTWPWLAGLLALVAARASSPDMPGSRQRPVHHDDEHGAGGELQEAGRIVSLDRGDHLRRGEHRQQRRCPDPLRPAPHEEQRAGDLRRREQDDVMGALGDEGLDARDDDQRAEGRPIRGQDPRRAHAAGSGSTNVRRAISVAS
jgi:rhombotail lipoprotein